MKPMRVLVIAALLGVGALVYILMSESRDERQTDRRGVERSDRSDRDATNERASDGEGAAKKQRGTGTLHATLKILMPDGSAAGGAQLTLRGRGESEEWADADGAIEFQGLHRGIYNVLARHGDAVGALDFELERTTDLGTIQLTEAVAIRGHVFDSQGAPVPGAVVDAPRMPEQKSFNMTTMVKVLMSPEEVVARTRAGEDGAYELLVPKAGYYSVRAHARGFAQEAEAPRPFTATVEGIDFYLLPGIGVSGRVTEANGTPIEGAAVMLVDPQSAFGKQLPKAESMTAADGTFEISATPTQQLLFIVRAAGYATHMDSNLTLPALDMQIKLETGVSVRLQAVDAAQKAVPAAGVSVAVMYKGGFAAGETDDSGALLLENLPTKGTRMWGSQQMAILWGGDFVAHMVQLTGKEPENGELDIGTVELARGGVVTGKVTDRTTGDPVAGVRLRTFGGLDQQLDMMGAVTALSAEDGTYKLKGVPHKAHSILAIHPDYISDFDPMKMMMSMRGQSAGEPIFADANLKAVRNIELTPAATLTGQVLGPDGEPVAGAKIEVEDELAMIRMVLGAGTIGAVSDAEGNFELKGLKVGQDVKVLASHRDFGGSEVTAGKAGEPITLTLSEPLMLSGLVVDETGIPIAGVRVAVARAQGRARRGNVVSAGDSAVGGARPAITDAAGKFTVRNAPAGKLTVTYEHTAYEVVNSSMDVAPGNDEHDLGKTILKRGLGIEGVVVDEDDKPVAGVSLNLNWDYSGGQSNAEETGRMHGQARSDEQGRFKLYGLRQGKFQLRVWQPGYYANAPTVESGTTDVRVVLEKAAQLNGRVMANGSPVVNANVSAEIVTATTAAGDTTKNVGWGRTDVDGRFHVRSLPKQTPFRLTIRHDGFQTLRVNGVTASDQEQSYTLDTGAQIGGIVVDTRGSPIPNVSVGVAVRSEDGNRNHKNVRTGADGRFIAGGLDAGEITVQLARWNTDYIPIEPFTVTPGDTAIRIVAEKGESIGGTIVDAAGKPLTQISITALDADAEQVGQTWAWEEDGSFHLGGLPKGRYTIRASRWVEGEMEVLAVVHDVATGTKDLELREGG